MPDNKDFQSARRFEEIINKRLVDNIYALNTNMGKLNNNMNDFFKNMDNNGRALAHTNRRLQDYHKTVKKLVKDESILVENQKNLLKYRKELITEIAKERSELTKLEQAGKKNTIEAKRTTESLKMMSKELGEINEKLPELYKNLSKVEKFKVLEKITISVAKTLKKEYAGALDTSTKASKAYINAADRLSSSQRIQNELERTRIDLLETLQPSEEGHIGSLRDNIEAAQNLADQEKILIKAAKLAEKGHLTYADAIEKARKSTERMSKAQKWLTDKTKIGLTTGALFALTWTNLTKKVRESADLFIRSGKTLPDTFGKGLKQVTAQTLALSKAMTRADITAIKLGVDIDKVRDEFTYLSEALRITNVDRIAGLLENVETLSRVMAVDTTSVIDAMKVKMLKMGQSAEEVTDDFSYMYRTVAEVNTVIGEGIIRMDDIANVMSEAATASTTYSQNTRLMAKVVMRATVALQAHGESYEAALDSAKGFVKLIQQTPEWMRWRIGQRLFADFQEPGRIDALIKKYPELEKQIRVLVKQGPGGMKILADLMAETEEGIALAIEEADRINKIGGGALGLSKILNLTSVEAANLSVLLTEINERGGFDNFIKGLDLSYEKAKTLSLITGALEKALNITKKEAEELHVELQKGPKEGEEALRKLKMAADALTISNRKAKAASAAAAKGAGKETENLVKMAQKGLQAYSALSGDVIKKVSRLIEDNPVLTGLIAATTGLTSVSLLLGRKAGKGVSADAKFIGMKVDELKPVIYASGAGGIGGIKGKLGGLLARIPGIGKGGLLGGGKLLGAGKMGLLKGAGAMAGGTALGMLGTRLAGMGEEDEAAARRRQVGGHIGTGVGMAAGTLLGGPVGMAIGGALGGAVGGVIGRYWKDITGYFKSSAKEIIGFWNDRTGGFFTWIYSKLEAAFNWIKTDIKTTFLNMQDSWRGLTSFMTDIYMEDWEQVTSKLLSAFGSKEYQKIRENERKTTAQLVLSNMDLLKASNFLNKNIVGTGKEMDRIKKKINSTIGLLQDAGKTDKEIAKALQKEYGGSILVIKKYMADEKKRNDIANAQAKKDAGRDDEGLKVPPSMRKARFYRRFTMGPRRDYPLTPTLPRAAREAAPAAPEVAKAVEYTPMAPPIVREEPSPERRVKLPVMQARAIGMSGNKAILEILNFENLVTEVNSRVTNTTM